MAQEAAESSSSCVTTDDQQQELSPAKIEALSPIEDLYSFSRAQDDLLISDSRDQQTCFGQINMDLPPFPVEEFRDFELLFQEMQNETWNSSDGGSSFCSSNSADFEGHLNFCFDQSFGEDILDIKLW